MPKRARDASEVAEAAATALHVAQELEDAGDATYARRCVEHSIEEARAAVSLADGPLRFREDSMLEAV